MGSVVHFKGKFQLIARGHVERGSVKDSRPYLGSEAGSKVGYCCCHVADGKWWMLCQDLVAPELYHAVTLPGPTIPHSRLPAPATSCAFLLS